MKGIILGMLLIASPAFALNVTIETLDQNIQPGTVATIDPQSSKIIELDLNGNTVWEYKIPFWNTIGGHLDRGADIEWIAKTDTFLFVVPGKGIYEVNRAKEIVWSYKTDKVSHDADVLPNGNILFINAWDNKFDPTYTEIDRAGNIIETWYVSDFLPDSERRVTPGKLYSYAHTNAVSRLSDGSTLVSLRNFNMYVIVKNGKIVYTSNKIDKVHDPVITKFGTCYGLRSPNSLECDGKRIFPNKKYRRWAPLRTVEPLDNGNFLITGSTRIGQVTPTGKLVWSINLDDFWFQKAKKERRFIYKATWVYKK